MSISRKVLEAHITLASGGYSSTIGQAANTKIVRLGMAAAISKPGGKEKPKARISIFNMPLADMEVLTTLEFQPLKAAKNRIALYAGDADALSLAFSGDIVSAVPNFNAAPDPSFELECMTGYVASITPAPPLSRPGAQDVAGLMAELAGQMGMAFSNHGVSVSVRNPVLSGGPMEQAQALARAARIELIVDDGEMVITPPAGLRAGLRAGLGAGQQDDDGATVVWSASSGMLGYPSFDSDGIVAKGIYEPRLMLGGPVRIDSIVPRASGLWRITSVTHALQAGYPGAQQWTSQIKATYPGAAAKKGDK